MKLGVMANGIAALGWEKALAWCQELRLEAIEVPCGLYPKHRLWDPETLVTDSSRQQQIREDLLRAQLTLSALSCAGNPVHPDPEQARRFEHIHDVTVRLAAQLGVDVVNCFSGCPGGGPADRTPNWITCPWPTEFERMHQYQWEEVLIPFWTRKAKEAESLGVRLALEMHPGMSVFHPESMLRLRHHAGPSLGCNFDPSHLFWQGIDPLEAIRVLGQADALFHVHAKDTALNSHQIRVHGVLDTKSYGDLKNRAWLFRTVGFGHDEILWRNLVSQLRTFGYDFVLSIEHEDSLMNWREGFEKAVEFLRRVVLRETPGNAWWF